LWKLVYWLGMPKCKPLMRNPLASGPVSQKLGWKEAAFMPNPVAAPRQEI